MAEKKKKLTKSQKNKVKRFVKTKWFISTVTVILLIVVIATLVLYFAFPTYWDKLVELITGKGSEPDISNPDGHLAVHFLDVGQGDCIIIELPDGKNMIIDAGGNENNNNNGESAETIILERIEALGIETFDYMLLTHTDSDHVDYMDSVLENTTVKNIYRPAFQSMSEYNADGRSKYGCITTVTYDNFIKAVDNEIATEGAKEYLNIKGLEPIVGTGYQIDIQAPTEKAYLASEVGNTDNKDKIPNMSGLIDAKEKNAVSPFTVLRFGNNPTRTIVFTGDAEGVVNKEGNGAEDEYLKEYRPSYDTDVLKVGHHGSRPSTSDAFLNAIDPEYAVISAGTKEEHGDPDKGLSGHPTEECRTRLDNYRDSKDEGDKAKIKKYITAWQGDITLRVSPVGVMKFETDYPDTNTAPPTNVAKLDISLPEKRDVFCYAA